MLGLTSDKGWDELGKHFLETEYDIVRVRQVVRNHAKELNMGIVDQTRITTAVSELFRNMYNYPGGGEVLVETGIVDGHQSLIVTCIDHGPGIADIDQAMSDGYTS